MNRKPNIQDLPATDPFWRAFQELMEDIYQRGGRTREEVAAMQKAWEDPDYRELEMRIYALIQEDSSAPYRSRYGPLGRPK
jgi:hypothetical protein